MYELLSFAECKARGTIERFRGMGNAEKGAFGGLCGVGLLRQCDPTLCCRTREGGYPVRRGFSVLSSASLEYWIAAFAAMTTECVFAFSRRDAPEVSLDMNSENQNSNLPVGQLIQ